METLILKFSELQLHPQLTAALEALKFETCTPVQTATMPHIIEGKDIAGLAQTGTGKTAAFLLPLMERILRARDLAHTEDEALKKRAFPDWRSNQFVLVLVPTRELCEQVYENAKSLSGMSGLRAVSIYGGVSYETQKKGLRDGVEFIIATPGRFIDLYKENLVDLKNVRAIVFDEADRMFDMGFKEDMKFLLQRVPKERQFLVFSATLNLDVMNTAYQFGADPIEVNVSRDQAKAENVEDQIFHIGQNEKPAHLLSILRKHKPRQAIVFSNYKMNVQRIAQFLSDNGVPAVGISSLLTQAQRNRVMEQFKAENDSNILVATDVAARGLDIKGVDMVVNYELPDDAENYVHRIGRTGRAGEKGIAFSFVSDRDVEALGRINEYLKHTVPTAWLDEADLVKEYKQMPSDHDVRGTKFTGTPREGGETRGPRPPRQGGGGGDRNRGPRKENREGGRPQQSAGQERGPRPQQAQNGERPSRPGARPDNRNRGPQAQRQAQGANGQSHKGQKPNQRGPQNKNQSQSRPGRPIPRQKSIGQKVSGFFKKLFS